MKTVADHTVLHSLTERFSALRPDSERRWGTLTAHEMLCHLGDAAEMVLRIRPRDRPVPSRQRRMIKLLGLWTPIRWPHGWKTNPAHDPRVGGTRPTTFATDLKRVLDGMHVIATARPEAVEPAHGFFGIMSVRDWQRWTYKHADHHLRQFGV